MNKLIQLYIKTNTVLDKAKVTDFLAPLALRLYLAPILWVAGFNKFNHFESTVGWFDGMGIPMPTLMAILATATEIIGAVLLFFGLGVRLISIPLMITMLVAAFTVHIQNGWLAIATGTGIFSTDRTVAAIDRLNKAKEVLNEYGNYEWLTEHGSFVVLNNGIEFAATYFIMLLVLFYMGSGRVSIEHLLCKKLCK